MNFTESNEIATTRPNFERLKTINPHFFPGHFALPWPEGKPVRTKLYRLRKHRPGGFRVVVGERAAEFINMERVVCKVVTRENRNSVYARPFEGTECVFWGHSSYSELRNWPQVEAENDRLRTEVSQLRRMMVKTQAEQPQSERGEFSAMSLEAAELLAIINETETEILLNILEQGEMLVSAVSDKLGCENTVRLANLLGNAKVAIVHDSRFVVTSFGRAVSRAIIALT